MPLLTWYDQAHLHREVCLAVLNAYLPHGAAHKLAQLVGVTPQWFAYFRQADSFSMPSLALAQRIAAKLPAPAAYRQAFVEHLAAARQAYVAAKQEIHNHAQSRLPISDYLQELDAAFYAANFGPNLQTTKQHYQRAFALARLIVTHAAPEVYPLEYMQTCATLLHICIALDQVADGLYWIKLGNHLAQQLTVNDLPTLLQRDQLRHRRYLLARDEALGYHHLGDDKKALLCYNHAAQQLGDHPNPRSQQGDLARNRLISLPGSGRFAIGDAEALAQRAIFVFEQKNDALGLLLNRQALAHAYLAVGNRKNLKKAERSLDGLLTELEALPNAGQIHRAVVLQTSAELCWRRGDQSNWQTLIRQTLEITRQAGLAHFYNQLCDQYGAALNPVLAMLSTEKPVDSKQENR